MIFRRPNVDVDVSARRKNSLKYLTLLWPWAWSSTFKTYSVYLSPPADDLLEATDKLNRFWRSRIKVKDKFGKISSIGL